MRQDFIKPYQTFIDKFGIDSQIDMCVEEMSELTKELVKLRRYKRENNTDKIKDTLENIIEELADVINITEELAYYYGNEQVEEVREYKIARALKKLENSNKGVNNG